MSYLSVPGHGTLRICASISKDSLVQLTYTGEHNDLIASGVVTAEMLQIRPRRRRDQMTGHQCFVLNRQWGERNGLAVRRYRIFWQDVPRSRLPEFAGGTLAVRQWEWVQREYNERSEVVAPAAEQRVEAEVSQILGRFMRNIPSVPDSNPGEVRS